MIFLVGPHASGKTEISKLLVQNHNILHIETSGVVKGFKAVHAPDEPIGEWVERMEKINGINFFDELILNYILKAIADQKNKPHEILITGNRMYSGIHYIIENLASFSDRVSILGVVVDEEILFERFRNRNRENGDSNMSFEAFQLKLEKERERGLKELYSHCDVIFDNNGDLDEFLHVVESYIVQEFPVYKELKSINFK